MEQKIKFIIIGLIGFCIICLFLFVQAASQQQKLIRESNDLKNENTALVSKANKLEKDLKETFDKLGATESERDRANQEIGELQKKLELVSRSRDELIEKLKQKSQEARSAVAQAAPAVAQAAPAAAPQNTDAYWGNVLRSKTDLEIQLSGMQVELKNLQISNEAMLREKGVLELDLNSLRNEKKDLLRQLDYNQKLLDSMSQEVVRERNDKVAIQESLKTLRAENNTLSRQLKSLVSRKEVLDKKVVELQGDKSTVEKRLNEMETMLTDKISKVDALKNELDAIKSGQAPNDLPAESVELPAIVVRSNPATDKSSAMVQEYPGKILAVNLDSNFVVIDLGSAAGTKVGDTFNVYRNAKMIGTVGVIQTRASISACDIKKMNTSFKIGDQVK
jgi:chromosome segregation ATPase